MAETSTFNTCLGDMQGNHCDTYSLPLCTIELIKDRKQVWKTEGERGGADQAEANIAIAEELT